MLVLYSTYFQEIIFFNKQKIILSWKFFYIFVNVLVIFIIFGLCEVWYQGNASSKYSRNSEADASEFLEYLEEMSFLVVAEILSLQSPVS